MILIKKSLKIYLKLEITIFAEWFFEKSDRDFTTT